jgi:hypothetical protein
MVGGKDNGDGNGDRHCSCDNCSCDGTGSPPRPAPVQTGDVTPGGRIRKIPSDAMWVQGAHEDGSSTIKMELLLHVDSNGRLYTRHEFQTAEDEKLSQGWASSGTRQVAHGFLTEAVRREVFCCVLLEMSKDESFLSKYLAADEDAKRKTVVALVKAVQESLSKTIPMLTPGSVKEILAMVTGQT